MGVYASQQLSAWRAATTKGVPATFRWSTPGAIDVATNTRGAPVTASQSGATIRVRGDPDRYRELGLVEGAAPTLLFVPTVYGDGTPPLGASVVFAGATYTVRDVAPVAPDGVLILARMVVAQ